MTQNSTNTLNDPNEKTISSSCFEVIEFSLMRKLPGGQSILGIYGINVAKVREVVNMPKINPLASRIEGVAGIFELRGVPIPAINLNQVLGDEDVDPTCNSQVIVGEFSFKRAGFMVHSTHRIRRVSWDKVMPPSSDNKSCISGMILIEDNEFLFILDLERILSTIEFISSGLHEHPQQVEGISASYKAAHTVSSESGPRLLFVDDSSLMIHNVGIALRAAGYRVLVAENGLRALQIIEEVVQGKYQGIEKIDCIITDVEMPLMDGITLLQNIKKNPVYARIPVIVHTSLSSAGNELAVKKMGAAGFVIKNDVNKLLSMIQKVFYDAGNKAAAV